LEPFPLTPHTYRILVGRGFKLICERCNLSIQLKVECTCKLCGHKTEILGEWSDVDYENKLKCEKCHSEKVDVKFIQWVKSKHRKGNHYFYHLECWDEMFQ